jgi:hypothetical protein
VYASADTEANVLSFTGEEGTYDVIYEKANSFTVHLPDKDLVFHRRKKLYVADFISLLQDKHLYLTKTYAKGEEARARVAYDLVCHSGYPLLQETIFLVPDDNMTHMPGITAEDVKQPLNIFGEPVGSIRGK